MSSVIQRKTDGRTLTLTWFGFSTLYIAPSGAPSGAPSNLTAMVINSTSVHLRWLQPDENQHNGEIRNYSIRIVELHSGREFQLDSTDATSIYTGLHPDYTYSFTVAAVTVNLGPYSDPAVATMPEDGTHISVISEC